MKEYVLAIKNYAKFTGRSRRRELWMFILFNMIFALAAMLLDRALGTTLAALPYGIIYIAYGLFTFLPGLAVAVRRMHDIGKSGWMLLIALIPLVGAIWLLVLYCKDSMPGDNEYGPNPKGVGGAPAAWPAA